MRRADREAPAASPTLYAALHPMCPRPGESRMKESGGRAHHVLFWTIALGGAAFDLATKAIIFARVGPPPSRPVSVIPNILELHTNYNSGALWGFGRSLPHSSAIFATLSVLAALAIL